MSKNIKDYLHLYLGCDIFIPRPEPDRKDDIMRLTAEKIFKYDLSNVKLLLHPLPDMTEDEARWLCELKEGTIIGQVDVINIKTHKVDFIDGEMDSGDGWCEMKDKEVLFKYMNAEQVRYLLSKHFDLFGLIEAGLAIDKTTLKQTPMNNKNNRREDENFKRTIEGDYVFDRSKWGCTYAGDIFLIHKIVKDEK
jgi:hypothetical protein